MHFEEERARDYLFGGYDRGIEALEMAGLQDAIVAAGGGDQGVGFFERGGYGFFYQHVDALLEELAADSRVLDRWDGHADGVGPAF